MSRRHALIVHTRMPAFDRDSGSQDVDNTIRWLLDAGWAVTFLAQEPEAETEERHAARLRQMGVATFAGFEWAPRLLRSYDFDLAVIAFWQMSTEIVPLVREISPGTRVVVNSMDVHFLRLARRSFGSCAPLDGSFGDETVRELNAYNDADAVLAVSDKERALLADFLGEDRVFTLPLAERVERSQVPLDERRGMYFVGNFRHVPNREALEFFAGEVLPLLDPELVERHPFTVLGNWLEHAPLTVDPATPGLNLVGWVPHLRPYMERSRLAVVPLLHGAGVKRKVLQSMMAYTPVVTTPVGAEGLDLVQGRHALIADDAADMAAGVTRLLTDDELWARLAAAGADHIDGRHGLEAIRLRFDKILDSVMARRPRVGTTEIAAADQGGRRADADAIRARLGLIAEPGAPVLVVSDGDERLVDLGAQPGWHFPEDREGGWAGFDPVDGRAAITHLDAQRERGARFFVLPDTAFSWRRRFPELFAHLESTARRVHQDEHAAVWDLDPVAPSAALPPAPEVSVFVAGTFAATRSGPAADLLNELRGADGLAVRQAWRADDDPAATTVVDDSGADFVVYLHDNAVLPSGFLADLIRTHVALGVDRLQPAHISGPQGGPPLTERHRGVFAREVDNVTPLPVLSVRAGADPVGPTVLADEVTVGLRRPIADEAGGDGFAEVRRVWVACAERGLNEVVRTEPASVPEISVLISTYNRTDLLREALASFAEQTIDTSRYEVVLVDDGSDAPVVDEMVAEFSDRMQVFGVQAGHAGRSAAKNLCVQLARGPLVLFFDDDDRVRPDYLERHLAAHAAHPDEGVAILGHTDWADDLEISPLMHFITDVDRLMFSYGSLTEGQSLDWRGFWEGRISCKRSLLTRHALHDQRLAYSIDVEMGWRLMPHGLRVVYDPSAVSEMVRPLDFDSFCDRTQAKGTALAVIASLHPGTQIADQLKLDEVTALWDDNKFREDELRRRVAALEAAAPSDESVLPELHEAYRETFRILHAKGVAETREGVYSMPRNPTTVQPFVGVGVDPELVHDGTPVDAPAEAKLSITIPVWSRNKKLARMAQETIERIWEVARVPTEVVVIDNGSPHEVPLAAKVYRYDENKGVATAWNTGMRLASADVLVVMNSDCRVEPGWDEALYEAATDGRRVAFPYTDHCDGKGFTLPDQGGTAGWCFMMSRAVQEEIGVFDEWFNPAFCEDTDYWHRAWQLGIELSPVPAAQVVHARRTTAATHPHVDWLLLGHRYKYGWKHGVDPLAAPPYYNRTIVEYPS